MKFKNRELSMIILAIVLLFIGSTSCDFKKSVSSESGKEIALRLEPGEGNPRNSEAARHDHMFLQEVEALPSGAIITFDKGYVDYARYEAFSEKSIWYVTRLKDNALYTSGKEFDIPDDTDFGVLKGEEVVLLYGENKTKEHKARSIAYWDSENQRLFEFITNNFELTAEKIALIYKKRWQIELLFKQLKQNFPLKYFLGDNENAIEIQIWAAMLANLQKANSR